jgi:hypothetical protein
MARNYREKKAISSEAIRAEKGSMKVLLSLGEEAFLIRLTMSPYLFEFREVKARLKEISKAWKKRIDLKKSRERSWENILYLVHLFPRSLEHPQFAWLKEKYFNILMRRQWDRELDKAYWETLDRVRKDFNPTKPKTPEKKLLIARKFEYYQNDWARGEIFKRCRELLEIYNSSGMEEEILKTQFLRKIKISGDIMERELERLDRICEIEIKDERDYLFLPLIIQNELNLIEDEEEKEEGQRFWMKIWKPISKEANKLKPSFMMEVAQETGLSLETVRKLLRKAKKESGD